MQTIYRNGICTVTRGDTFTATVFINAGTELEPMRYVFKANDKLLLGITQNNQCFENAIIRKVFTIDDVNDSGDVVIRLDAEDTMCLKPGKYFYQLKLVSTDSNNVVNTIITQTPFMIED